MVPRVDVGPFRLATVLLVAGSLDACGGDGGTLPSPTPTPLTREQAVREAVRTKLGKSLDVSELSKRPMTRAA